MDNSPQPLLGIGACLQGQPVRYNRDTKRANDSVRRLGDHFELRSFCPEVAIGLGVPREPIRLVGDETSVRAMDSATQEIDHTVALTDYACTVLELAPEMCGYILVKGSPSCGWERVKRYDEQGNAVARDARGVFAAALNTADPLMPLEDDGRLNDAPLRDSFVSRAMAYHAWKAMCREGLSPRSLTEFHARHKYLIMAHDYNRYRELGRLAASAGVRPIEEVSDEYVHGLMEALRRPATRRSHANALMHVMGYLKRSLSSRERQQLRDNIEQYREGTIPLIVPVTLLRHHFSNHPDPYIDSQVFLSPYPDTLRLRNQL